MPGSQSVLTETFFSLIAQEASAEVILEVLVDEAAMFFPSLDRTDLEAIVVSVLEEACRMDAAAKASGNVVRFQPRPAAERLTH